MTSKRFVTPDRHGFGKIVAGGEEEHGYVFICSR